MRVRWWRTSDKTEKNIKSRHCAQHRNEHSKNFILVVELNFIAKQNTDKTRRALIYFLPDICRFLLCDLIGILQVAKMFWEVNSYSESIDSLLSKEDLTLKELLDDEDILQDYKDQNKNLTQL